MTQGGDGGFLSGYLGTDWLRSILYKHYNLSPKTSTSKPYSLLFVQRTHNRNWVNPSLYTKTIQRKFKEVFFCFRNSPIENSTKRVLLVFNHIREANPWFLSHGYSSHSSRCGYYQLHFPSSSFCGDWSFSSSLHWILPCWNCFTCPPSLHLRSQLWLFNVSRKRPSFPRWWL